MHCEMKWINTLIYLAIVASVNGMSPNRAFIAASDADMDTLKAESIMKVGLKCQNVSWLTVTIKKK